MRPAFFLISVVLFGVIFCDGCDNLDKYPFKDVTRIPSSPAAETTQGKGWEHVQGGSLEADRQAALQMNRRLKVVSECSNYTLQFLGCGVAGFWKRTLTALPSRFNGGATCLSGFRRAGRKADSQSADLLQFILQGLIFNCASSLSLLSLR